MTPFRASPGFTETWQHFDFAVDDGVATLTFNRPEKLNALTFDVYADLRDLLAELPHRGDARVSSSPARDAASARAATSRRSSASSSTCRPPSCSSSRG